MTVGRRWASLALTAFAFAGVLTGCQSSSPNAPSQQQTSASALNAFYRDLNALETGRREDPVVVLQIGDSHTAGDRFTGRLRAQLQSRFGDAGRGYLQPGVPFAYYNPSGVFAEQSDGWEAVGSLSRNAPGPFGLSGYRQTAVDAGEVMRLTSDTFAGFDYAWLQIAARPGGGRLFVSADGGGIGEVATDSARPESRRVELSIPAGTRTLQVETLDDAPVSLAGWGVGRNQPGVVVDAIGVGGATVSVVDNWSPDRVADEVAERDPSLVILSFGTNEGYDNTLDLDAYRQVWRARLNQVQRWAPNASIVVIGAPDGNRRARGCPDLDDPSDGICAPLAPTEVETYLDLLADDSDGPDICRFHPPPNLGSVRAIQREVAASQGVWYWDWSTVMGGACGIHNWVIASTPLAYNDHVHLRDEGYLISADAFYSALMEGYAEWSSGPVAELPAHQLAEAGPSH
ncbi:MAG: GDSL-type esterase/lipase family protein [Pseudomonadota bacterium]